VRSIVSLLAVRTAIVVAIAANPLNAQGPVPKDLVVTPAWLAAHLNQPNLVILHVGPAEAFDQKHIAGAHFVSLDAISVSEHSGKGLMLEMPRADKLREGLESLGISDNSTIVVYNASEWFTPSTRLMFTLDYAGLGDRAHYLDGGLEAWLREGHPVTTEKTAPGAGHLSALRTRPIVVDAEYVHSHLADPHVAVVDARASVYYDGIDAGRDHDGSALRRGHIAGARSIPFTEMTDDQTMLKSVDQLRAIFAKAGVQPGDTIVGYCHVGQQATGMLFGARLLGHPVRLYDGSYEDWSRHTEYPVEASPARKKP